MISIEFFVPGEAKPTQRGRTFYNKRMGRVQTLTDPKGRVTKWRERIYLEAQKHAPAVPWEGPLSFTAIFVFARPDGHYNTKDELNAEGKRRRKPLGGVGDWDNLGKACSDAMEGLVYRNDNQLAPVLVDKVYAGRGEPEGVYLTIRFEDSPAESPDVAVAAPGTRRRLAAGVSDAGTRTGPQIASEGVM